MAKSNGVQYPITLPEWYIREFRTTLFWHPFLSCFLRKCPLQKINVMLDVSTPEGWVDMQMPIMKFCLCIRTSEFRNMNMYRIG